MAVLCMMTVTRITQSGRDPRCKGGSMQLICSRSDTMAPPPVQPANGFTPCVTEWLDQHCADKYSGFSCQDRAGEPRVLWTEMQRGRPLEQISVANLVQVVDVTVGS